MLVVPHGGKQQTSAIAAAAAAKATCASLCYVPRARQQGAHVSPYFWMEPTGNIYSYHYSSCVLFIIIKRRLILHHVIAVPTNVIWYVLIRNCGCDVAAFTGISTQPRRRRRSYPCPPSPSWSGSTGSNLGHKQASSSPTPLSPPRGGIFPRGVKYGPTYYVPVVLHIGTSTTTLSYFCLWLLPFLLRHGTPSQTL